MLFDIWTEEGTYAKYVMDANNQGEAIGRARERWNIPNKKILYAVPQVEDENAERFQSLATEIHANGLNVYKAWQYARENKYHDAAARLESVFQMINRSYVAMTGFSEIIDATNQRNKKIALDARTIRSNRQPSSKKEVAG